MARRKSYENIVAPRLEQIRDWRRNGAKIDWIAEQLGINRSTFFRWIKDNKDLEDVLKEAESNFYLTAKLTAENTLLNKIQDRMEVAEETVEQWKDETGKVIKQHVIKRKRLIHADTTAVIFALKTLDKERWNKEDVELAQARIAKVKLETDKIEKGEDVGTLILNRLAGYVDDTDDDT